MVRLRRLELPRVLPHSDLNAARLPIPPQPLTQYCFQSKTKYDIFLWKATRICKKYPMIEWKHESCLVDYRFAEEAMSKRVEDIILNKKPELIWCLEHDNIYTQGTSSKSSDLKVDIQAPLYPTKRGGQTTYHGPGQRILYLMLDLRRGPKDIKKLVWNIEEWLILVLRNIGLSGYRLPGLTGVWVRDLNSTNVDGTHDKKIAALGLRVKKWVTFHGLSLNVNTNLSFFNPINPCGISGKGVTSLKELGIEVTMEEIDTIFRNTFEKVFK